MNVHSGTVITEEWLRHKCCSLAALPSSVADNVLKLHHVITCSQNICEAIVDFHLSGSTNFVVRAFYKKPNLSKLHNHFIAKISKLICWRHWEISTLNARTVSAVRSSICIFFNSGIPCAFIRINLMISSVDISLKANTIKYIELSFWCKECCVSDSLCAHEVNCLSNNTTRVTAIC
ncbi:unannotated protein [freshwater metagenome]|uniref:Unannotated protein n=1 Tax=freshwater metagenome TaxID=449393 RepID=A0A6J6Z286_9ZZZZ